MAFLFAQVFRRGGFGGALRRRGQESRQPLRWRLFLVKSDGDASQPDLIAVLERASHRTKIVQVNAVFALEVAEDIVRPLALHEEVLFGNARVRNAHFNIRRPSNGEALPRHLHGPAFFLFRIVK